MPHVNVLAEKLLQSSLLVAIAHATLTGDDDVLGTKPPKELSNCKTEASKTSRDNVAPVWPAKCNFQSKSAHRPSSAL